MLQKVLRRKPSGWTKTLYQNNLNNIKFFFTFFKGIDVLSYRNNTKDSQFLTGTEENNYRISQEL